MRFMWWMLSTSISLLVWTLTKMDSRSTSAAEAAKAGDLTKVKELVEGGADVNEKGEAGMTALMWVAGNGYIDVVRFLTEEHGADINATNEDGSTAQMWAAGRGGIEVVRYLARCGADVNTKNKFGYTALIWAASNGHIEVVRCLVGELGADVNAKEEYGYTALMKAAGSGHVKVVRYLTEESGADVNAINKDGSTALTEAARHGDIEVVRYLAEKPDEGVDVTGESKSTALMRAAERGHVEVVQFLAEESGVDVNATNKDGSTALMKAARYGHIEVVRYLADDRSADVDAKTNDGSTALMNAAWNGRIEVARYLAESGTDVNTKNKDGMTATRLAADRGFHDIQQILIPFLHLREANLPMTTATADLSSNHSSSWSIPPSEIALTEFVKSGNVGGDYRAKWLDADAAVKLFIPDAAHASFVDEVRLWQKLRHPNVLKMYGASYAVSGLQFFVCEYASNGSLIEYVTSIPEEKRMVWKHLHGAALGLEYLHERGIVHGNLRCSNILIGSDGLSKLSNFGLSGSTSLASSGIGSMRWQSPEVLEGKPSSFASDMYSLGMCVLEAATGKVPWVNNTIEYTARLTKIRWAPEVNDFVRWAPVCPPGDARDLVWRMCCKDPARRMSLSSVVFELGVLAMKESSQPEHEPTTTFDKFKGGNAGKVWTDVEKHMEKCGDAQYHQVFDELKKVHEYLQDSAHHSTQLAQFFALLTEFQAMISMSPDQALAMRLSSTRATSNSFFAFHRQIESLLAKLGESVDSMKERQARWDEQRRELFVSGVSDVYLRLNDLKSAEERAIFLKTLKAEARNPQSKYTSNQMEVMKKALEVIETKIESLPNFIPEWFIPWYELIVYEGNRLGSGGFGSVYRAKWLDSEVVVKRLDVDGDNDNFSSFQSSSAEPEASSNQMHSSKREKDLAMFKREVGIWFEFRHPHVIQLFGACHVGRPFFICEYATNGTLISYLKKHPDELWVKLHEAALGVQYLHAREVVHGDLKGNNVVIGSDLKAKVTDFGLSSLTRDPDKAQISAASHWVAPECFEASAQQTFASDIYSLGMCIVESLRVVDGEEICLPWRNLENASVRYHAKRGRLPIKPKTCEDDQWELVKRMCAFEPKSRIKISTVVDELVSLANKKSDEKTATVSLESVPGLILSARRLLAGLQDNQSELPMYASLWDRLECVHNQIAGKVTSKSRAALYSLVRDAHVATMALEDTKRSLIAVADTTMRFYALNRRLDKFLDAYSISHETGWGAGGG